MEKRKSDRQHVCTGVLLTCILLFLASGRLDGSEPAGPPAKDCRTAAAAPPNEMAVALKEIPVWEAHERVRFSFLTGLPSYTSPQGDANIRYPTLKSGTPLYGRIGPGNLPDARREGGVGNRGGLVFVLDFSDKPVVVFVQPMRNGRISLGSQARIKAVLVDPVLNIMVRRLEDMSHPEKKPYKTPDGQEMTYEQGPSLDPKVTIARTNGAIVAEGMMPFG
jgi:hypothetical protein